MNVADIRNSECDEFKAQYTHGPSGQPSVTYVYRRSAGTEFKQWVVFGPSAFTYAII